MAIKIDALRNNDIYLVGDEKLETGEVVMSQSDGEHEAFIRCTNIEGIFKYGIKQIHDDGLGHQAGYTWASRAGVMNKKFDIAIIECLYKQQGRISYEDCAIDLAHLEGLLEGTPYYIDWEPCENSDTDVRYRIMIDRDKQRMM